MNALPGKGCPKNVSEQWDWSSKFSKQALKEIASYMSQAIYEKALASEYDDLQRATDLTIRLPETFGANIDIQQRIRRVESAGKFRDLTIRSKLRTGKKTELHKFREGHCDLFFLAWVNGERIEEFVIVDIEIMRLSGLLDDDRPDKWNRDRRSAFRSYRLEELQDVGALVYGVKYPGDPVSFTWRAS